MHKLCLVFILFCTTSFAASEFKIFTLQHRFASDLIPIVEPIVGDDGSVHAINSQLIVRTSPERMQDIEALVAQMDTARVNRKITVSTRNNMQTQRERVEATGSVIIGKATISSDRRAKPGSGRVDTENRTSNTRQNSSQFLNVLDGERAFIRVGQIVPFTQEWVTITRRYIQVDRFTDWRDVTTGFAVRPRTIGSEIELEITPRIARLNNQGFIDFEELSTVIRAPLGSWVDIGGTMQNNDEVSRKILGRQSATSQQNNHLSVRVD